MGNKKRGLICLTGWSDSGKTTLITRLIQHFTSQGYKVGAVKSTHQQVDQDKEGSDSSKFFASGADPVLLLARNRSYLFGGARDLTEDLLDTYFKDAEIVIIEGILLPGGIHLEVAGGANAPRELKNPLGSQDILITDSPELKKKAKESGIPVFTRDDKALYLYLEELLWKER